MPKRPTGQGNAVLQPGRTKHQRQADDYLTERGWHFARRTGHGANLYYHPDGRKIMVNGTPASPSNEFDRIKREARGAATPNEGEIVSSTEAVASPVTQYVAMSDPFLLKQPTSRLEQSARINALSGWIKRVLERHGPVLATDLVAAAEQMGFSPSQVKRARLGAGVVSYVVPGENIGKGKGAGAAATRVALPHQVPEGVSRSGRSTTEPERGVAAVSGEEHDGHTIAVGVPDFIGDREGTTQSYANGTGPERTPDEQAFVERAEEVMREVPTASVLHLKPAPRSTPPETHSENRDDISAAALMLLESLGVKKPGDEARQELRAALTAVREVGAAVRSAEAALDRALQSLA